MAALPYMQLYIADYLADTSHLSTLEHGVYLLLMMNYWQRGKPLPAGDEKVARIARITTEEWLAVKDNILPFFTEKDGQLVHHRIDRDLAAVLEKSEQAAAAGRSSAAKRYGNGSSTNVERSLNGCSTDVERSSNHTDTDTDIDTETEDIKEDPATDVAGPPSEGTSGSKITDPVAIELANRWETLMRANYPKIVEHMGKNYLVAWQEVFDRLIRIDKREPDEIRRLVEHCFNKERSWWANTGNIRSPIKLRERNKEKIYYYDVILEEMKHEAHKQNSGRNGNRKGNPAPYGDGQPVRYDLIINTETGEFIDQTRKQPCQNRTG